MKGRKMSRRELLAAASAGWVYGCATLPRASGNAAKEDRSACDHDLCRYFRRRSPDGESGMGYCSIGVPEELA